MILSHPTFEKMIEFDEELIDILVVENQKQFSSYLFELNEQICGEQGKFSLFSGIDAISFDKVRLIFSPIGLSVNTKDIISQVVNKVSKFALDEDHYVHTNEILSEVNSYLNELLFDFDPDISFSDINAADLVKYSNVMFVESNTPILERIMNYLEICKKYSKYQLFVFVNLKSYLDSSELVQLYDFIIYSKINVLLMESTLRCISDRERITVIDKDLCEIHLENR